MWLHFRLGDFLPFLRDIPGGVADLFIADPPYDSLEKHRAHGTTTRLTGGWFETISPFLYGEMILEAGRILKDNSHAYFFASEEILSTVADMAFRLSRFKRWRPLIWDKQTMGMGYPFRRSYEIVLWAEMGSKKGCPTNITDVLSERKLFGQGLYPTQKPIPLVDKFFEMSGHPGGIVVDPFAGSGVVAESAANAGMNYLGGDISPQSKERLRDVKTRRFPQSSEGPSWLRPGRGTEAPAAAPDDGAAKEGHGRIPESMQGNLPLFD